MKAIIKYPGSKWSIANWIINKFPEHHSYLELFFGSGAVLFNKSRSNIETVNDLDDNVINLFNWIKNDPEKLAHEIYFTPYARNIYENSNDNIPEESLAKAVNFCIQINMGYGCRILDRVGWKKDVYGREKAYSAIDWCKLPDRIIQASERLRGVQIENKPAVELAQQFNHKNVLIYADPSYMQETRCCKQYNHEMNDEEHSNLLDVLLAHKGPVLISGYDNDLYNDRLKNWYKGETISYTRNGTRKREILWMNFEPVSQLSLFD